MSDITATLRVSSPDLALTATVAHDDAATVRPVSGRGTVPNLGTHLFTVQTDDFDRFEAGLDSDATIDAYERVLEDDGEAVYSFEYAAGATAFSAAVSDANGVSLDWTNEDDASWTVRVWLPDRAALASLWEYATERGIEFSLQRVRDDASPAETGVGLTDDQEEAILLALEMGYFEEPRAATLREVAAELGISQPAAGGLLRRGIRRLIVSTVAGDGDGVGDER
ncbi:helix-turn-helix domain-containing protein [Halobacterium yunchengense]|uniref:helix-turn-helix domain-containing protein n=1 Tax=Halobacterium yunchengense TaxID=3108497 RepID=UPI00300A8289